MDHGFSIEESQPVTKIGATFDGKISLSDSSGRVVASFSTGSPIYSHHHILSDFECHWFSYSSDIVKKILSLNFEDLVDGAPLISKEGVTYGSRECTLFVVEAKTGRLIRTYPSSGFLSTEQTDGEKRVELHPLYIRRTDYTLHCTAQDSKKDLWRMKVVDIEYEFTSQKTSTISMSYERGPAINTAFEMPPANQSKGVIQRFQQIDNDATCRIYLFSTDEVAVLVLPLPKSDFPSGSAALSSHLILPDFIYRDAQVVKEQKRHLENYLNSLTVACVEGFMIGNIFASRKVIAKGSNGTVVFEGNYKDLDVAVKRLVRTHCGKDSNEIQNLIASHGHPNIVRLYAVEYTEDFVFIALERCTCSLEDLILVISLPDYDIPRAVIDGRHLDSVKHIRQDLWKANCRPSPMLLKLMRDMVSGLMQLHMLGKIHGHLNPQNVLILFEEQSMSAKLSDMGIDRFLHEDWSSLRKPTTGCDSPGWQAPEQLVNGSQTQASDLFSLGWVLFYCITLGEHPFDYGDKHENNIKNNTVELSLLYRENTAEAGHIIPLMLNPAPELRPSALEVLHHPLFWSSEMRLSFLCDTSDRVELEDRRSASKLLNALESIASVAIGGQWNEKLDMAFNIRHSCERCYRCDSVQDLLLYTRNKLNNFGELSVEIKELVGGDKEGLFEYFASRFPQLLIEVYKVMCIYCREEKSFQKYFKSSES